MKHSRTSTLSAALVVATLFAISIPALASMMAPPSISIVSPASGATVREAAIPVTVSIHNFNLECSNVGKTNAPMGEGHVHVMVDGMDMAHLIGPYCSKNVSVPGQGLAPGTHTLTVALANDAHAMNSMPASISFNYEPTNSTAVPGAMGGGKPSLVILSPKNGASVGKRFNVVLAVNNFDLSCNLEGKKDIAGWGHEHVFVQQNGETSAAPSTPMVALMETPEGMKMGKMLMQQIHMSMDQLKPMMMMAEPAMIGMPCTKTIPVDLSAWHSGAAKLMVQLANNDHMPTMGTAPAIIDVRVK